MKIIDIIQTANRNLLRSKLRTILTISAIFVGAFTLTLTTSLGSGVQQYLDRQLGNVSAPGVFFVSPKYELNPFSNSSEPAKYDPNKKAASAEFQTLTQSDLDKLRTLKDLDYVRPYYSLSGEYMTRNGESDKFTSNMLSQYSGLSLDLSAGRLLNNNDLNSMILPDDYLKALGFSDANDAVDKTIVIAYKNLLGQTIEKEVTIVGVMKKSFITQGESYIDSVLAEEIATAQGQKERFLAAFVKFKDVNTPESDLKQRITAVGDFSALSLRERVNTIMTVVSAITAALNVVGAIALFAASFGIINTLLMSVYERTQEIGLMKALGMHRSSVFALFAFEAVLVGFWGSLVAVIAGFGASQLINNLAKESFLKDFEGFELLVLTPANAVFVIALIMTIAFLAGTLPAIKASRLNPIEALRNE